MTSDTLRNTALLVFFLFLIAQYVLFIGIRRELNTIRVPSERLIHPSDIPWKDNYHYRRA